MGESESRLCWTGEEIQCLLTFNMCWPFAFSAFSGTGVVTSVPSDAPDDIAALRDIKKKQVTFKLNFL